jgi:hypothetical protein
MMRAGWSSKNNQLLNGKALLKSGDSYERSFDNSSTRLFDTKKIFIVEKKILFATKKIVIVAKKILFDAKKIVIAPKKIVFDTKKIVFDAKGMFLT